MRVEEAVLPGVGHKFTIYTSKGDRIVIIIHQTGNREIYFYEDDEDEPAVEIELTDEEARAVGAILAGVIYHPEVVGDARARVKELVLELVKVEPGHPCAKKKLEEWLRRAPGVHVLGVLREDQALYPNPPGDLVLEVGDVLIVAGSRTAVDRFKEVTC